MKPYLLLLLLLPAVTGYSRSSFLPGATSASGSDTTIPGNCRQCMILAEQSQNRIVIVETASQKIIWEWKPEQSNIKKEDVKWFFTPDDAKPVYNNQYILMNASGGGVALIRIADKKAVFYAYVGRNPHSSELLPDGNIVTASSTDSRLVIFRVDTLQDPDNLYRKVIPLPFAHNVVWDKARQILWSAGQAELYSLQYNFDCARPDLIIKDSISIPGAQAHDLFPVYGKDELWLTNTTHVFRFDPGIRKLTRANTTYQQNIKSVSSGPEGYPVIIILPKEKWWTDEVIDTTGKSIFREPGLKIYKARWLLPNHFSYVPGDACKICTP